MKKCPKCKKSKDITQFYIDTNNKSGYAVYCISCVRIKNRNYKKKNLQRIMKKSNKIGLYRANAQVGYAVKIGRLPNL